MAAHEPTTTLGFWAGIITGLIVGTLAGGIALIGQGVWEHGRWIGARECALETQSN